MTRDGVTPDRPRIDVTGLPPAVAELVEALGPGEELVITRDGEPIATVRGARPPLVEAARPDHDVVAVVATAMKLSAAARSALSAELGPGYLVLDLREAPPTADVVLVPPGSPQLVAAVRSQFPGAQVVVTEIEDVELGVGYAGPVRRLLDAGADTYLSSTTVPRLAAQLGRAVGERKQLTDGSSGGWAMLSR